MTRTPGQKPEARSQHQLRLADLRPLLAAAVVIKQGFNSVLCFSLPHDTHVHNVY
jgi:hypothetical protein